MTGTNVGAMDRKATFRFTHVATKNVRIMHLYIPGKPDCLFIF